MTEVEWYQDQIRSGITPRLQPPLRDTVLAGLTDDERAAYLARVDAFMANQS